MRKWKKNIDTLCEFRPGDVIIKIDGTTKFCVIGAYETTMWYSLECLDDSRWTMQDKTFIDANFVKVGRYRELKK